MFSAELKASSHSWLVPLLGHSTPHELLAPCWLGLHVDAVLSHPAPNYLVGSFSVMITVDPIGWWSLSPSNVSERLGFRTQSTQCFFTRPHMAGNAAGVPSAAPRWRSQCVRSQRTLRQRHHAGLGHAGLLQRGTPRRGQAMQRRSAEKSAQCEGQQQPTMQGDICGNVYIYILVAFLARL